MSEVHRLDAQIKELLYDRDGQSRYSSDAILNALLTEAMRAVCGLADAATGRGEGASRTAHEVATQFGERLRDSVAAVYRARATPKTH